MYYITIYKYGLVVLNLPPATSGVVVGTVVEVGTGVVLGVVLDTGKHVWGC